MPIYAYQCAACGHNQDVLQKLSDTPLSQCPACQSDSFHKQLSAAEVHSKDASALAYPQCAAAQHGANPCAACPASQFV